LACYLRDFTDTRWDEDKEAAAADDRAMFFQPQASEHLQELEGMFRDMQTRCFCISISQIKNVGLKSFLRKLNGLFVHILRTVCSLSISNEESRSQSRA
jgi:hypothetical protein